MQLSSELSKIMPFVFMRLQADYPQCENSRMARPREITPEQIRQAKRLRRAGATQAEIAGRLGIGQASVARRLGAGTGYRRADAREIAERDAGIRLAAGGGVKVAELARNHGLTPARVYQILKGER